MYYTCPITSLPAMDEDSMNNGTFYKIHFQYDTHQILLSNLFPNFSDEEYFAKNKYIIAGAILTKQYLNEGVFKLNTDNWKEIIANAIYPKTPQEKLDNLIKSLYDLQKQDGQHIIIEDLIKNPGFYHKLFFRTDSECLFYLQEAAYKNLIEINPNNSPRWFKFKLEGLNYYLQLLSSGSNSKKCFIAMSFGKEMLPIRNAIRAALDGTGFESIIVDEQHISNEQTINDAIISGIRSSKFCIADFTEQKDGVYFESGFALGLGKPVIYCCRNDHFKSSHFDTNHFPHILYNTPEELKISLINKIEAWIK